MGIALLLTFFGCMMIFLGIRDQGFIDIKATFVEGRVESGLVGVLLIFASAVICVMSLRAFDKPARIKIQRGDFQLEWEGHLHGAIAQEVLMSQGRLLDALKDELPQSQNGEPHKQRSGDAE